jgi:hypothetical protein
MKILGHIGAPGLALILTVVLILGTRTDGKAKTLAWGQALFVGLLAGASYQAAGPPWDLVSSLINDDLLGVAFAAYPGLSMPAVCCLIVASLAYKRMKPRAAGLHAIVLTYVAGGAGGVWAYGSTVIALVVQRASA